MNNTDARREHIGKLCDEHGGKLSIELRRELARQYGCKEPTIYFDVMYVLSNFDSKALRYVIRRKWSGRNAAAERADIFPELDFDALLELFIRQGGVCFKCGRKRERAELHIDHIKPLSAGGRHHIDNIALLCPTCNTGKSYRRERDDGRRLRIIKVILYDNEHEAISSLLTLDDRRNVLMKAVGLLQNA